MQIYEFLNCNPEPKEVYCLTEIFRTFSGCFLKIVGKFCVEKFSENFVLENFQKIHDECK